MKIKINEIFLSIQGEGLQSGLPTIFIRTTGCNLRCEWCDTQYAYNDGEELSLGEIIEECKKYKTKNVCLTGGEPLLHKEESLQLIKELVEKNFEVVVETNGAVVFKASIPRR
jgi:7-carboxy-7-deazaguanine synthase